jgi:DMATS type aromatic prenyltransferase
MAFGLCSQRPQEDESLTQETSLMDRLGGELARLCKVVGTEPETPVELLAGLLGPHGARPAAAPPVWPSDVADDHSPVEFSLAFNDNEPPALRILGEALGSTPGVRANMSAAEDFLEAYAGKFGLSLRRLDMVRDLFDSHQPQGAYALWLSLVFRNGRRPEFKVYFNPEVRGAENASELVGEALHRLGLSDAYRAMLARAVRPGELGVRDRLTFFALDLFDEPQARVKLYVSHFDAEAHDVARAASIVDGVDPEMVSGFCAAAGARQRFDARPLVGSYTITSDADRPVGYSVYVPIRSYVEDDLEARSRVVALLARHRFDTELFDRALGALTARPLADGVGLIPHVSLRLGPPRPGVTVYLSAEAYGVFPPRTAGVQAA